MTMLLSRALRHVTGCIEYLDKSWEAIPLAEYRTIAISVYPQDSYIFQGTIRDYLNPNGSFNDLQLVTLLKELSSIMDINESIISDRLSLDFQIESNKFISW